MKQRISKYGTQMEHKLTVPMVQRIAGCMDVPHLAAELPLGIVERAGVFLGEDILPGEHFTFGDFSAEEAAILVYLAIRRAQEALGVQLVAPAHEQPRT